MKPVGMKSGPMNLPVSYTKEQLAYFRWSAKEGKFLNPRPRATKIRTGPVKVTRAASHYWRTNEYH